MLTFLYVIQFIISLSLIVIVMFQKTEGGTGLINSNQYNSFFSNKSFAANPLGRITLILGFLFFINCILIAGLLSGQSKEKNSIIDQIEKNADTSKDLKSEKNKAVNNLKKELNINTAKDSNKQVPLAK